MAQGPTDQGRKARGFQPAFALVREPVRAVSESRGFAVSRLLTHWAEVVGPELAAATRPVKVSYGREGLGATLTLLVQGAMAPMVEMQKARIRDRVNGVYGYNAISRIFLTQTSAAGFAEGRTPFSPAAPRDPGADPETAARAASAVAPITDEGLRSALELLARNILSRHRPSERKD
jgi:hypothetical protein